MALEVEDGTGKSDADSFVSLAFADAFFSDFGGTWTYTDAQKEAALRRATAWLSSAFRWKGDRTHGRDQALAWPRSGVQDIDCEAVDDDIVPPEVQRATCRAAAVEAANPYSLTPELGRLAIKEKVGPIEVMYADSDKSEARPKLTAVYDDIRGLIRLEIYPTGIVV